MKILSGKKARKNLLSAVFLSILLSGCGGIRSFSAKENLLLSSTADPNEKITASSSTPAVTDSQTIPVKFEFDSPTNLKPSDIAVSGGVIYGCSKTSSTSFNCTLIPKSKNVSVQIISGTIKDSNGEDAGSSNALSFVVDSADKVYGLCIKKSQYEEKFGSLRW